MDKEDRYTRFNLRLPKDTYDKLKRMAEDNSHSMNAEIIQRLERSFIDNPHQTIPIDRMWEGPLNEEEQIEILKVFEKAHLRTRDQMFNKKNKED